MRKQLHSQWKHRTIRKVLRGVALVEALVAILLFAFGVLGLVGLQASMTRAQGAGKYRADASNLASEVIGLMWTDNPKVGGHLTNYTTANCDGYDPCNAWKQKVTSTLPQGGATVTADASSGAVTVTLTWTIPNDGTAISGSHQYATSTNVLIN
jgi:type IV pilus assembly protein PilV